jgi:hypothetical protein
MKGVLQWGVVLLDAKLRKGAQAAKTFTFFLDEEINKEIKADL